MRDGGTSKGELSSGHARSSKKKEGKKEILTMVGAEKALSASLGENGNRRRVNVDESTATATFGIFGSGRWGGLP